MDNHLTRQEYRQKLNLKWRNTHEEIFKKLLPWVSLPVLALELSDELPLLFVDVKVYAAAGYHLGRVSVTHESTQK